MPAFLTKRLKYLCFISSLSLILSMGLILSVSLVPFSTLAHEGSVTYADKVALNVMSYNIRVDGKEDSPRWDVRKAPLASQISFFAPDIFGLQEARGYVIDYLAQNIKGYAHYGISRDDGKDDGETTVLFYRKDRFELISTRTYWCSQTPDVPSLGWDAAFKRTITQVVLRDKISGQIIDARNTHFDHVGKLAQTNCAVVMQNIPRAKLGKKTAIIVVTGDLNVTPDSQAYANMTQGLGLNLKDTRLSSEISFGPVGTFNGFDLAVKDAKTIDYIFTDRAVTVQRHAVFTDSITGKVISDHFPVFATLLIPTLGKTLAKPHVHNALKHRRKR